MILANTERPSADLGETLISHYSCTSRKGERSLPRDDGSCTDCNSPHPSIESNVVRKRFEKPDLNEMLTVKPAGHLRPHARDEAGETLRLLKPCKIFFRLFSVRLWQLEKSSICVSYVDWFLRMAVWSSLLSYAVVQALRLFSLLTNIKKGGWGSLISLI